MLSEASVRDVLWNVKGDHVWVEGILFRHAANRAQLGAVQLNGNNSVLVNCVVERTSALGAFFSGRDHVVRDCVMQDNGWDGFDASGTDRLVITGCLVRNNNT